jgi:hypothetical protein
MSRIRLPDPEAARQEISEAVPELALSIARQARAYANAVSRFLEQGGLRRSTTEAAELIHEIGAAPHARDSWAGSADKILVGFFPFDGSYPSRVYETLRPAIETTERFERENAGKGKNGARNRTLWDASESELRPILGGLHRGLLTLEDRLPRSVPRPPLLPAQHPPPFARLRKDAVAETVAEQLAAAIDEGAKQYEAAQKGGWPGTAFGTMHGPLPPDAALTQYFEEQFDPFHTKDVVERYRIAVGELPDREQIFLPLQGFEHVEMLGSGHSSTGQWIDSKVSTRYREIAGGIHPRIYSAYVAIALNYLAEVLELMPKYAEDSGQGMRRDPITIHARNIGWIGDGNNSHITVADTITSIDESIQAVANTGRTDAAAAIRALAEAIQHDPELAENLRDQLLDNVADVADAAAAPAEPRRLNRARAAMAAITAAAGTSSQLAQAVSTWHGVLGKLF